MASKHIGELLAKRLASVGEPVFQVVKDRSFSVALPAGNKASKAEFNQLFSSNCNYLGNFRKICGCCRENRYEVKAPLGETW